jgi:hypothetical protein
VTELVEVFRTPYWRVDIPDGRGPERGDYILHAGPSCYRITNVAREGEGWALTCERVGYGAWRGDSARVFDWAWRTKAPMSDEKTPLLTDDADSYLRMMTPIGLDILEKQKRSGAGATNHFHGFAQDVHARDGRLIHAELADDGIWKLLDANTGEFLELLIVRETVSVPIDDPDGGRRGD